MTLVANWRRVLRRAWSLRLIGLTAALSALEVGFAAFSDAPPIPRGTFAVLSMVTTFAAAIARVVAQPGISGDQE